MANATSLLNKEFEPVNGYSPRIAYERHTDRLHYYCGEGSCRLDYYQPMIGRRRISECEVHYFPSPKT
jgi:hypothetical protein